MFSNLKPTFGTSTNNTSFGFTGMSNVNSNPFGQPTFGKPSGMGFSGTSSTPFGSTPAPLFGQTAPQHGTSLFGTNTQNTSFGQPTSTQPTFGSTMFGTPQNQTTGPSLFGSPNTSSFGQQNKPGGFGFGTNSGTTGFFGQQNNTVQSQQPSASLFGQNTNNLFGSNQGFGSGAPGAPTGTVVKFQLVTGTDTMVKGNINQTISTRHHCITCMKEYEGKSLEELRWEDYQANRKGVMQGSQPSTGLFGGINQSVGSGLFGSSSIATSSTPLFGQTDNKSVFGSSANTGGFGQASSAFGATAATSTSGLFGKPITGFGTTTSTSSAFGFNPSGSTNLFGSSSVSKPFGTTPQPTTNLFGQQPTGFGTQNTFGSFSTSTNQNTPLFNQQKTTMPGFNMGSSSAAGFGAFSQTGPATSGALFSGVKSNNTFGGFGTTSSAAPMFGASTFGQPNQSLFSSSFNKPASNLFGQTNTAPSTGTIGTGTNLFGSNMPKAGGLFGATPGMFNTGFGANVMNNSFLMAGSQGSQSNAANAPTIQAKDEQIISMSSTPFGLPSHLTGVTEPKPNIQDLSRPTNPTELTSLINQAARPIGVMDSNSEKLQPQQIFGRKVPIFDGLEQREEVVVNFRINSPHPKRLVLRNKDRYKVVDNEGDMSHHRNDPEDLIIDDDPNEIVDVSNATQKCDFSPRRRRHVRSQSPVHEDFIPHQSPPLSPQQSPKCSPRTSPIPSGLAAMIGRRSPELSMRTLSFEYSPSKYAQGTEGEQEDNEQFLEASENLADNTFEILQTGQNPDAEDPEPEIREPHPTGIILTRPEYYTKPSLDELLLYISEDGSCIVKGFTIGRYGYGNVRFSDAFDVSNLNLDELVHFRDKEINIYPDESKKPPLGHGLNRRAQVTLDKVWPYNRKLKTVIKDVDELVRMDYAERLRRLCERQNTRFVEYRPDTGSWVFKVEHFSKYGHHDSDDEEYEAEQAKELEKKKLEAKQANHTEILAGLGLPPEANVLQAKKVSYIATYMDTEELDAAPVNLFQFDKQEYKLDSEKMTETLEIPKYCLMKSTFFQEPVRAESHNQYELEAIGLNVDPHIYNINHLQTQSLFEKEILSVDMESDSLEASDLTFMKGLPGLDNLNTTIWDDENEAAASEFSQIYSDIGTLSYAESKLYQDSVFDTIAFRGRSFKVGWGRGFSFITPFIMDLVEEDDSLAFGIFDKIIENAYSSFVHFVKIGHTDEVDKSSLGRQLHSQLDHSTCTINNELPYFNSTKGFGLLESNRNLMQSLTTSTQDGGIRYTSNIWHLFNALWGSLENEDIYDYDRMTIKKRLVSEWLQDVVGSSVDTVLDDIRSRNLSDMTKILTYLSGHRLDEAASTALNSKNTRLSLLLSQIPVPSDIKMFLVEQLSLWKENSKDNLVSTEVMKLYMLLAGIPAMKYHDEYVNVCDTMNWLRSFAIYYWYVGTPADPIAKVVHTYEKAFKDYLCATRPSPLYDEQLQSEYDLIYHLLKYYCDDKYDLDAALNPTSYTADCLDYSLSWFVLQTLSSLDINVISKKVEQHICLNFAAQLENMGHWHWAIFVLLFIQEQNVKKYSVGRLIERHVQLQGEHSNQYREKESLIVNKFNLTNSWLDSAKADKALACHKFRAASYYLQYSYRWIEAHKVLFNHVVPDHYICFDYEHLKNVLAPLKIPSAGIETWESTGSFILNLLEMTDLFNEAIFAETNLQKNRLLQKFRSIFSNLSLQFENFPNTTYMHDICLAEMSTRIMDMIRILFKLPKFKQENALMYNKSGGRLSSIPRESLVKEIVTTIDKYISSVSQKSNTNINSQKEKSKNMLEMLSA